MANLTPMSTAERQLTRQGQDRKAELIRQAEILFVERGYAETRMLDIAKAAGVAKGLFYWYFESKEALFSEIVVDLRDRLRHAQAEALTGLDDPLEMLYVGTVASVKFIAEHHRVYGMVNVVTAQRGDRADLTRTSSDHARDTSNVIGEGQKRGLIRTDDSAADLAYGNAGITNYSVAVWANGGFGGDVDKAAHFAARYVLRAVAADETIADRVIAARGPAAAA